MMLKITKSFVLLLLSISLLSCMFLEHENLKIISPHELHQLMNEEDIFLADVHIPEQRHIKGTDVFVSFHKVEEYIDKFPEKKETPIYLYCKSGPMGNAAARALFKLGYTNVYNLEGGLDKWLESGYKIE